jgi:hypothetical protein
LLLSFLQQTELLISKFCYATQKNNGENSAVNSRRTVTGKTLQNVRKTTTANKKQLVDIKVPTARERAKEFDEARRHDAESNEL